MGIAIGGVVLFLLVNLLGTLSISVFVSSI